jgi:UDP-glucuronate 4-epimerase
MTILVTGAAGFIGFHTARRLMADGAAVAGIDNFNSYYDPALKEARWSELEAAGGFTGVRVDIADRAGMEKIFAEVKPARVVHLAAQAGVRHGVAHPHDYAGSNLTGMLNVLEGCRAAKVEHLVYASTSSVYGANGAMPFSEHHGTAHQLSLYAATKRAGEAMAHSYAHLYGIPSTGLRFFTVYGPWGRPDMALFKFTAAMLNGEPIPVFNNGEMARDFTYIDDIVEGVVRVLAAPPDANSKWMADEMDPATSGAAPHRLFNIGRGAPVKLMDFIAVLEKELGLTAEKDFQTMQPGDVEKTWCDVSELDAAVGYRPSVSIEDGVAKFVAWYRDFYKT